MLKRPVSKQWDPQALEGYFGSAKSPCIIIAFHRDDIELLQVCHVYILVQGLWPGIPFDQEKLPFFEVKEVFPCLVKPFQKEKKAVYLCLPKWSDWVFVAYTVFSEPSTGLLSWTWNWEVWGSLRAVNLTQVPCWPQRASTSEGLAPNVHGQLITNNSLGKRLEPHTKIFGHKFQVLHSL